MAGHPRYTALLDANVLFAVPICDALMSVAATGIYAAKWTARIDEEWVRNLERARGVAAGAFQGRCDAMHRAFPDWEVPQVAWQALEVGLVLPDPDDRHVLAAAVAGHADCIVTMNLRDFPPEVLTPFGIEALHPDDFLSAQLELDFVTVLPAFKQQRQRLRRPEVDAERFVSGLERHGLTRTASILRGAMALL